MQLGARLINMRVHVLRLRLIGALLVAFLVSPALAGFAAAAACAGDDAMPCCLHESAPTSVQAGCCRIDQAPAPMRAPAPAPRSDSSSIMVIAPAAAVLIGALVIDSPTAAASRGPTSPGLPLYLDLCAIRR